MRGKVYVAQFCSSFGDLPHQVLQLLLGDVPGGESSVQLPPRKKSIELLETYTILINLTNKSVGEKIISLRFEQLKE